MNLFFKKLTGKLLSTEKLEAIIQQNKDDVVRYRQIEASDTLKEYNELKEIIEAPEFQEKKRKLTTTKYNDTEVHHTLKHLRSLDKNKELQLFLYVSKSELLDEYLKFRQSEDYVKLSDKESVAQSPDLKRMQKFEKSKAYLTWKKISETELPKEYQDLQEKTSTEEFKQEKLFWKNPRRWLTTPEYKQECRFAELAASKDIRFFLSQKKEKIEKIESYQTCFSDDFDWKKMSDSLWQPGFAYKSDALKQQHSFINEHQAYNGGHNTGTVNGYLTILTHKEEVTAPAWDEKKGFVNHDFEYTSDVIQTAKAFAQEQGVFMAKIRCEGKVHHTVSLGCNEKLPLVHLYNFDGKKMHIGYADKDGFKGEIVTGLSWSKYYIITLHWTKDEMIWYVNNIEVFRINKHLPAQALHFTIASFLPKAEKPAEGHIDVDWIRVYKKA